MSIYLDYNSTTPIDLRVLDYMIEIQHVSRKRILERIKPYKIRNIVCSKDSNGDTGMNIILLTKNNNNVDEIIENVKNIYNVEIRRMWKGLYFENNLFKTNKLTDKDLKYKQCDKTRKIISRMIVISIPPILSETDEEIIAKVIIDLKGKKYIE